MVNKILILSIITLLGLVSCVEKQNFDQLDDLFIEPTIEGSILYVEAPEDVFNQPIVGGSVSQDFNFDGFIWLNAQQYCVHVKKTMQK